MISNFSCLGFGYLAPGSDRVWSGVEEEGQIIKQTVWASTGIAMRSMSFLQDLRGLCPLYQVCYQVQRKWRPVCVLENKCSPCFVSNCLSVNCIFWRPLLIQRWILMGNKLIKFWCIKTANHKRNRYIKHKHHTPQEKWLHKNIGDIKVSFKISK